MLPTRIKKAEKTLNMCRERMATIMVINVNMKSIIARGILGLSTLILTIVNMKLMIRKNGRIETKNKKGIDTNSRNIPPMSIMMKYGLYGILRIPLTIKDTPPGRRASLE